MKFGDHVVGQETIREGSKIGLLYLIIRSWEIIRDNGVYAWNFVRASAPANDLVSVLKREYNPALIKEQARCGAYISMAVLVIGLLIGRLGFMIQDASHFDYLGRAGVFVAATGWFIREFGQLVRGMATLWAIFWFGVIAIKTVVALKLLRVASKLVNKVRNMTATLASDYVLEDKFFTGPEIFPAPLSKEVSDFYLTTFAWIITFGIFTQMPWVLSVDASLGNFVLLICVCIALMLIGFVLEIDMLQWARRFNIAVFIGLVVYFFVQSPAYAAIQAAYRNTDSGRADIISQAIKRTGAGQETESDKQLLGPVVMADLWKIKWVRANPSGNDKCDLEAVNALQKRANATLNGQTVLVVVPDCVKKTEDEATAKKEKEKGPVLTDAQKKIKERQEALARVLGGRKSEKPGDRATLDGVYINAVDLRDLQLQRNLDECKQGRVAALKRRVDSYAAGREYVDLKVPVCKSPVPIVRPNVDDTLAKAAEEIQKKYGN